MPVVVFALLAIFAFLAFVMDVMRNILEIQQLKFAAKVAALDVLPFACLDANGMPQNTPVCNPDGSLTQAALSQMQAELSRTNSSGPTWNQAISNPTDSGNWLTPVSLQGTDLSSVAVQGSTDAQDPLIQLSVRRSGSEAIKFFLLPSLYAANMLSGSSSAPASSKQADLVQTVEVVGQPATRIGPGAALDASSGKAQVLAAGRLASFPIAINYDDFKRAVSSAGAASTSLVHLNNPGTSQYSASNEMRGYFVNLKSGGQINDYYWDAQNPSRVSDLIGLIEYFNAEQNVPEAVIEPAALERGVQLDRFASSSFSGNADLATVVSQLPTNRCYIVPVVRETVGSQCEVLGFAWLNLKSTEKKGALWDFTFSASESLPVLNASAGSGLKSIPKFDGTPLPALYDAQNNPFAMRKFNPATNTLSARPKGVVLAPTVSPRRIDSHS